MRRFPYAIVTAAMALILLVQCSKKGEKIVEPYFGIYGFRTYTTDTFRFRIVMNDRVLTDSLLSPIDFFSTPVNFFNTAGRLQIIDAKHNDQLLIDTTITMKTGTTNYSIVQLGKGQKPFIPPPPNEPPPAPGNYKVRFQYLAFPGDNVLAPRPFFYDSVRCIIRNNGIPIATLVLDKFEATPYYEGTVGSNFFTIRLEHPVTSALIDASTSPTIGAGLTGFNTVSLSGVANNDYRTTPIY